MHMHVPFAKFRQPQWYLQDYRPSDNKPATLRHLPAAKYA